MSLRRFNTDLRAARLQIDDPGIPGVLSIERGDSEGEAKITFVHEKLDEPLSIQLLANNLDAYPDDSKFLLFTDTDDIPPVIASALEELQETTLGQAILQCVRHVSAGLIAALSTIDVDGDIAMGENGTETYDDDEDLDWDEDLDGDDELFGLPSARPTTSKSEGSGVNLSEGLHQLKKDLRAARQAGCKVGILNGLNGHSLTHTISLSMRASKFGLSSETLEVWDIEPSDYIVLLIELEGQYQSASQLRSNPRTPRMAFRFGKCSTYKPSFQAASDAFNPTIRPTSTVQDTSRVEPEANSFTKIFISNSLERFISEDFIHLVKLRLSGSESWEDANQRLQDMTNIQNTVDMDYKKKTSEEGKGRRKAKRLFQELDQGSADDAVQNVLSDPFTVPHDNISLPLTAMHFATHYFTRCTEYCLRCHQRLPKDFEALKPFVCSNPLCLFQYMTMGLGPSIEHEILTQPYVVDLLISLCYSSVTIIPKPPTGYPIREFPVGLRLKVPQLSSAAFELPPLGGPEEVAGASIQVEGDLDAQFLTFANPEDLLRLSPGMSAFLQQRPLSSPEQPLQHQVLVKDIDHALNRVAFEFEHRDSPPNATSLCFDKNMVLSLANMDFDDLNEYEKALAISMLLRSLPSIADLQKYLLEHPYASLTSHPNVSHSARTLLQWIVASNRSYILQVSPVEENKGDSNFIRHTKTRPQEEILGLDSGYVQFRFAQGSPDKELRFHRALSSLTTQKARKYPTIFAWHGSRLSNWHSILRQGLDYTQIQNGRAFGHGVYFSNHYETSAQYAQESLCWPNSALQAAKVVSLCEIVNSPEKFISTKPFYVVSNVDWIQCRYLFVQRKNLLGNTVCLIDGGNPAQVDEIPQDPSYRVLGPNARQMKIPTKAIPSSRIAQNPKSKEPQVSVKRLKTSNDSAESDEEELSDLEAILSDDGSSASSSSQLQTEDAATALEPLTDFRPDALVLSSLPRLALPKWADSKSSKRLAADIKRLQKVQTTTPLHELGWYVHLDNIENMYQWIVELHTFDPELPLAKDMKRAGITSIVLEVRFGRDFPFSPPFVRVIRPRFLPFMNGGGK